MHLLEKYGGNVINGHEWEDTINNRTHGNGCLICSNRKVMKGVNDLLSQYPIIAKEWNYERNGKLKPEDIVYGSTKVVWWKCSNGHEYKQKICYRTKNNYGCPYCSKKRILKGFNDLESQYPMLAMEWNSEKNGKKLPANIIINSPEKFWWKCSKCNYEWQASLYNRINKKSGCPKCGILKQIQSFNNNQIIKKGSLEENNPTLAKEWNFERNKNLTPDKIIATSNKKVWWKCSNGHEWIASICKRNNGTGCPYCDKSAKKKVKNIDTGKIFDSLSAAAKSCGLKTGDTISNCCKGKQKSAGGFRWKFVENKQF